MRIVGFIIRIYHDARSHERKMCQKLPPLNEAALCRLGLTQHGLD